MAEKRILVIGSAPIHGVKCCNWDEERFPTIPDYDVAILNMRSLGDSAKEGAYDLLSFRELASNIKRSLASKGEIIVIVKYDVYVKLIPPHGSVLTITFIEWLFEYLSVESESTETFRKTCDMFGKYIQNLEKLSSHTVKFCINQTSLPKHARVINLAETREGKSLALTVVQYNTTERMVRQVGGIKTSIGAPGTIIGQVVFLPELPNLSEEENIRFVLEDIGWIPNSEIPTWAKDIGTERINSCKKQILEIQNQLQMLNQDLTQVSFELERLHSYKRMLVASGTELEMIFRKCLEDLGGEVVPSKYSQEEYILKHNNAEYLVEAKGNGKSVSLTDMRQLIDYLLQVEADTGVKGKGILFGNAWRSIPVSERDTNDKPYFPQNVVERAIREDISLVSSWDFFQAFMLFSDGKIKGSLVLDAVTTPKGLKRLLAKV